MTRSPRLPSVSPASASSRAFFSASSLATLAAPSFRSCTASGEMPSANLNGVSLPGPVEGCSRAHSRAQKDLARIAGEHR